MSNWKIRERELAAAAEAARKGTVFHHSIRIIAPEPPITDEPPVTHTPNLVIPGGGKSARTTRFIGVTFRKGA
jgi:hypothetical protein